MEERIFSLGSGKEHPAKSCPYRNLSLTGFGETSERFRNGFSPDFTKKKLCYLDSDNSLHS